MPKCMICGKLFKAIMSTHVKTHGLSMHEYCSQFPEAQIYSEETIEKWSRAGTGKKHTEETKRKISAAQKGSKHGPMSEEQKRTISKTLKGRPHSEEHNRHISESHKKIDHPWLKEPRKERIIKICPYCGTEVSYLPWEAKAYRGFCSSEHWYNYLRENPSEHHNWKGGLSRTPYSTEFDKYLKQQIRERDDFKCQLCGKSEKENTSDGRALAVHHIDYDKSNCVPENLITLCTACNAKINYNREYWQIHFQEIMNKKGQEKCKLQS